MARKAPTRPTDAELEILRVFWRRGPATVREVHESLDRHPSIGYTTVLKLLQIMTEKGLVHRDETERTHVYAASLGEAEAQQKLVDELLEKAFGGSASQLVMRALSAKPASPAELAEIRKLLRDLEGDSKR